MMTWLDGKKTYLLVTAYCLLVLFGQAPEGGITMPDAGQLQQIVLGAAVAALRAGVAKARA